MTSPQKTAPAEVTADLYLDLLKQVLTRTGLESYELPGPWGWKRKLYIPVKFLLHLVWDLQLVKKIDPERRKAGADWPADAETMVGMERLDNLHECIRNIINDGVPGDLIETGVWRGGASIFMRGALKAYGDQERIVWVADSFEGLPPGDESRGVKYEGDDLHKFSELAVPLETVKANFAKYRLLDDRVRFLQGFFADTLPTAPVERLSLMRLDGDMYDSTMVALESLYPKLSVGGYVIIDDYGALVECKEATEDFRRKHDITDELKQIDWAGHYWRKSR